METCLLFDAFGALILALSEKMWIINKRSVKNCISYFFVPFVIFYVKCLINQHLLRIAQNVALAE